MTTRVRWEIFTERKILSPAGAIPTETAPWDSDSLGGNDWLQVHKSSASADQERHRPPHTKIEFFYPFCVGKRPLGVHTAAAFP